MAYDVIKQSHPHAPTVVGARVVERLSGRLGTVAPPSPGRAGIGVRFDGQFGVVDCPPDRLAYAAPPPSPSQLWCAR
ncbi:hypothetical protein [Methylobacterium brachiatum]|uniref:hypothetical protein n=1 Tax=Methylobacterium brachiatum TaxID=269660 RepID=UPI002446F9EA|nr:hypothetical protein [Methylobacterium brachiatum]MDH2313090.1 hypothetical protein [Methylobacterium brachiatum]